jgi:phosphate transport system substrate-binding protein
MSQKNELPILILALLITLSLLSGGIWWFLNNSKINTFNQSNNSDNSNNSNNNNNSNNSNNIITNFNEVKNVPSGTFSYGGSTVWASIRGKIDQDLKVVFPTFQLRYLNPTQGAPSSGKGITMLLENQLDFAQSSRSLTDEEYQKAQQRGFKIKEIPVAIDGMAIVVNPNLNIAGLTVNQFCDIYSGKINNWSQVGGENIEIHPYLKQDQEVFPCDLAVKDVTQNVKFINTTTEALRKIATDKNGIYWSSASLLVSQCTVKTIPVGISSDQLIPPYQMPFIPLDQCQQNPNKINIDVFKTGQYPLSRRLLVIVKEDGNQAQKAGEAYGNLLLTQQGQKMIEELGFVPLR